MENNPPISMCKDRHNFINQIDLDVFFYQQDD